jgi:hypothetical protein
VCGCGALKCGGKVLPKQIGLGGSGQKLMFFAQGAKNVLRAEHFGLKTTIAHMPAWRITAILTISLGYKCK